MDKTIEFFSGSGVLSETLEDFGFRTLTVDIDEKLSPDICKDISDMTVKDIPNDFKKPFYIHGSPCCNTFSSGSYSYYWDKLDDKRYAPKSKNGFPTKKGLVAYDHLGYVLKYLYFVNKLKPSFWTMENPKCALTSNIMDMFGLKHPIGFITYCQYGEDNMKPTHIWGKLPNTFEFRNCKNGDNCHQSAPRGSDNGTQGKKNSFERAKLPKQFCVEIAESLKNTL